VVGGEGGGLRGGGVNAGVCLCMDVVNKGDSTSRHCADTWARRSEEERTK
jgi:hypothetical protein